MIEYARNAPQTLSEALDLVQAAHAAYADHLEACASCQGDLYCATEQYLDQVAEDVSWSLGRFSRRGGHLTVVK